MKDSQRRAMFAKMRQFEVTTNRMDFNDMPAQIYAKNKQAALQQIRPKLLKGEKVIKIYESKWPKKKSFDPMTASSEERINETPKIVKMEKELGKRR